MAGKPKLTPVPSIRTLPQLAYINGEHTPARSGGWYSIINPADGSVVDQVADTGPQDAQAAIEAAAAAFPIWRALPTKERAQYLRRAHELMIARADEIATLVTLENGKPLDEARREVIFAGEYLSWFAEELRRANAQGVPSPFAQRHFFIVQQPVGVVAAITPWNFPATMITRKVAPAIAAGCTVVLKPAPQTPLTALAIARVFHDAGLPRGVFNVLPASVEQAPQIGEVFVNHEAVRKIAFTGSTAVGKLLMRGAANSVKRLSFELGGNAPFIVFEDADLDRAVEDAVALKFLRVGGQSCICANRFFIHDSLHAQFVERFTEKVRALNTNPGMVPGAQVGPLIDARALERVSALVAEAVRDGGLVLTGGKRLTGGAYDQGNFFPPTVIVNVQDEMRIAREEIFGPVAPILTFHTEEEVARRANATRFGLAGYLYTRDLNRVFRLTQSLECGLMGVNDAAGYTHEVPFGGVKESGLGREGGKSGLEAYLEEKTVTLRW